MFIPSPATRPPPGFVLHTAAPVVVYISSMEHGTSPIRSPRPPGVSTINPYRILWHASPGLAIVLYMLKTYPSTRAPVIALAIAAGVFALIDVLRFTTRLGRDLFWKYLRFLASGKERRGPNTSLYYALSLLAAILLFPPKIAMAAIICLCIGDPVAGIAGRLAGRHRLRGKSFEGAAANFLVCAAILWPLFSFGAGGSASASVGSAAAVGAAGAAVGSLAEFLPLPLDDNIVIPLAAGGAMILAQAIL